MRRETGLPMVNERWKVNDGRAVEPTQGADCDSSYVLKLSRGEQSASSLVEFAAPSSVTSLGAARQALTPYLGDAQPPRRLIVELDGTSREVPPAQDS